MLKTHWRFISRIERVGDNVIIVVSFFLAYFLRDIFLRNFNSWIFPSSLPQELNKLGPLQGYIIVLGVALPVYNALLSIFGAYRSMRFQSTLQLSKLFLLSSGLVFLCEGFAFYFLKLDLSRSFLAIFCAFSGVLLLIERYGVLQFLRYWRVRGKNFRNLLIVGTGDQAQNLYREIARHSELGVKVVGFVEMSPEERDGMPGCFSAKDGFPSKGQGSRVSGRQEFASSAPSHFPNIIATFETFELALKKHAIDEVLFTDVSKSFSKVEEIAQIAAEEGIGVTLAADLFSLEIVMSEMSYFGGTPLIHYHPLPGESGALVIKRAIDIFVSTLLLLILSPFLILLAILIKLDGSGPVFFRQSRVGLNGRPFVLLKFRSMVEGAEDLLSGLRGRNEMTGPVFKLKEDPRVTRIGRILRRFSMDELPQLLNVLRGDMSLVGPRPPLPEEVALYVRKHRRRLSMRPGLTCTWQVSGRNEIPDFEKWAELDLQYIDSWSLGKDLRLLVKTIPAVLMGTGAR